MEKRLLLLEKYCELLRDNRVIGWMTFILKNGGGANEKESES